MTAASTMILLAGALRQSPLRERLDVPVLALPLASRYLLLDAWLERLGELPSVNRLVIVVNSHADAGYLRVVVDGNDLPAGLEVEVMVDPAPWRGPAGLIYDITSRWEQPEGVIVGEAGCLPPRSLAGFMAAAAETSVGGLVAATPSRQPAGLYGFSREALAAIPSVGFFDIKEQLLPRLYENGVVIRAESIDEEVHRLRTREAYLDAVNEVAEGLTADGWNRREGSGFTDCAESAQVAGTTVLQPGVVLEDGAVVHDSVVFAGARIGRGAVVSRSVIGPQSVVRSHDKVIRDVIDDGGRVLEASMRGHRPGTEKSRAGTAPSVTGGRI